MVARGEFDLERIGACSDEVEDLGVLLDRVLSAPWNRGEGRLADAGESRPAAVHEIASPKAVTYVWLVDAHFTPVSSPPSMFDGMTAA